MTKCAAACDAEKALLAQREEAEKLREELEQLRSKVHRALIHLETSYASVQAARTKLEEE